MADEQYLRLIHKIAELEHRIANMIRPATVHEVKGDQMRMVIGRDEQGQDVLGPWTDTTDHRGGARERRFYKKGQNLMLISPNGDMSQSCIAPFAPNKDHKTPDHANKSGQDEETYQLDDLRVKKTKKGYWFYFQAPKQDQQQQSSESDSINNGKVTTPPEHEPQEPDPEMAFHLSKDRGITGRIGKDVRFSATKDGAKLKAGSNFTTVTKDKIIHKASGNVYIHADGTPYVNKPWQEGSAPGDPVSDDDEIGDKEQSTSQ